MGLYSKICVTEQWYSSYNAPPTFCHSKLILQGIIILSQRTYSRTLSALIDPLMFMCRKRKQSSNQSITAEVNFQLTGLNIHSVKENETGIGLSTWSNYASWHGSVTCYHTAVHLTWDTRFCHIQHSSALSSYDYNFFKHLDNFS